MGGKTAESAEGGWVAAVRTPRGRTGRAIVLGGLVVGAGGMLALWRQSGEAARWLAVAERCVGAAGPWGPAAFVGLYAGSMCAFVPSAPLTVLGAVLFGPWRGFAYVWVAGVLGATGSFCVARALGRDFAERHGGARFRGFDEVAERNGFKAVLLLRAANLPLTPLSFALGVTRVRLWDYVVGTALGIVPGTLAVTYVAGRAAEGLEGAARNSWPETLAASCALLALLLLLAFGARAWLKEQGRQRAAGRAET